ncbi:hypothetical protein PG294_09445 [Riemerella anatipestifer]|uniref:hypothetical protein n=1 Tax=Riemerella anatipestifer TaxID=34085 RepID=UPI000A92879F|nr:hypothetical protein [Riemerella anatipestifer]MBT0572676.1 hypothetical protein [Riemerella anatipestifer]MCQ4155821.1 DUF1804 family protein [Riemerella anatipestifer]MDD1540065.1 hypothetical protein [Riemerella anatipestifer]MDR7775874.1 hypothetical protein [Riemerella anatipestifer]MDR7784508.1 hypothetical protein [Riemerella anatipestifer]
MKPIYTTIPVDLCEYALVSRKINHLLLFVYLKHISSGHVRFDTSLYKYWATDLGVSEKTIRSCIKWLIKKKWITVNNKRNTLRIISYGQLKRKLRLKGKSAIIYEPDDFSGFSKFCCGVAVTKIFRLIRWMNRKRSVSKMAYTSTSRSKSSKGFQPIPLKRLAKSLKVSNSTANNYKKKAKEAGFIETKRQVTTLTDTNDDKILKENLYVFNSLCILNNTDF